MHKHPFSFLSKKINVIISCPQQLYQLGLSEAYKTLGGGINMERILLVENGLGKGETGLSTKQNSE